MKVRIEHPTMAELRARLRELQQAKTTLLGLPPLEQIEAEIRRVRFLMGDDQ